jgi:hypothetical protein
MIDTAEHVYSGVEIARLIAIPLFLWILAVLGRAQTTAQVTTKQINRGRRLRLVANSLSFIRH